MAFADRLQDICATHDIPIVADEIQTGIGRSGAFLASEMLGLDQLMADTKGNG